jgi:8-amino-7-oxononanoate synthase
MTTYSPTHVIPTEVSSCDVARFPETEALWARVTQIGFHDSAWPLARITSGPNAATAGINGRSCINFSGYNYLGLANHPLVLKAAHDALDTYGASASASRIAGGNMQPHVDLEAALARFLGVEAALVFPAGHFTNLVSISSLVRPGKDVIFMDSLVHNSVVLGARLAGAQTYSYPHNNLKMLAGMLALHRPRYERALIITEGVFSADGDLPDLAAMVQVARAHDAMIMIDEAHSVGVVGATGRGIGEAAGVDRRAVTVWMGTLSKALGSCGGYIAGSHDLIHLLRYTNGGFMFSAGMPPATAAAALAALHVLEQEPQRVRAVQRNANLFRRLAQDAGLAIGGSVAPSPVVPVMVGDDVPTMQLATELYHDGINVGPMISPAVPHGKARLRFFLTSEHTEEQIRRAVEVVGKRLVPIHYRAPMSTPNLAQPM